MNHIYEIAAMCADNAGEEWKKEAYDRFVSFAGQGKAFLTEDVREANPDMPQPHDLRAWGHIAAKARREGIVKVVGRVKSKSKEGTRYMTLWQLASINSVAA